MSNIITLKKNNQKEIDWDNVEISNELISSIPLESAVEYRFVPFREEGGVLSIAMVDFEDRDSQNALRFYIDKQNKKALIYKVSEELFPTILNKLKSPEIEISKAVESFKKESEESRQKKPVKASRSGDGQLNVIQEAPVAKMVEVIIKNAIEGGSSDIHIEPLEKKVRIRYRVDGVLHSSLFLPKNIGPAVVSRVKILSNLKIDEKRKPQDGRFRIKKGEEFIDFRVSTFPVSQGEKVVMRILDKDDNLINLKTLGFMGRDLEKINEVTTEPYGIILITGPTGSGKSTTLYSLLRILNKEGTNIVTLEDPVEYVLEGVSQSQVRPEIDYTFASGLRSILRQDPDIIMVGEIRDSETAELTVHAALTGHLVLSTLHTNTAIGAVSRLVDMGTKSFLLSSALKIVIGQRLVRRICNNCKKERKGISQEVIAMVKQELKDIPEDVLKDYLGYNPLKEPEKIKFYEGQGCRNCGDQGMKGRILISEIFDVNKEIAQMIGDSKDEYSLLNATQKDGFTTMKQDGMIKVLKGETTIEEIQRVTDDTSGKEVISAKGE
ncbi:MAG: type II/IV secretion system protein [Candidatus Moranbacteria bacterium]|nr:type II/IV secretion system protein [Candidatus Moranbacteria bacterium]